MSNDVMVQIEEELSRRAEARRKFQTHIRTILEEMDFFSDHVPEC